MPASSGTVSLLQSTEDANIIFINIDWKRSRHDSPASTHRNLGVLSNTIASIVTNMKPDAICCCEVGEAMKPMTTVQMSAIVNTIRTTWEATATEHPDISVLFAQGAPYLTIWDGNRCQCTHGRILEDVYVVQGHRRTAQAFLFLLPGMNDEDGLDVFNVHAPSGQPKLRDSQRYHLIKNMLQSSSMTRPNKRIGECRFLLGGDMNTTAVPYTDVEH